MCVYEYTYTNTHTYIHMQQTHTQKRMALINPFELYVTQCDRDYAALGHADMSFTRWKTLARVRRIMNSNSCFTSWWVKDHLWIHVILPMYVHVCTCVCVCPCVYIYIHGHAHTRTYACMTHTPKWPSQIFLNDLWLRALETSSTGPGRGLSNQVKMLAKIRRVRYSNSCLVLWWACYQFGIHVMSPLYVHACILESACTCVYMNI